MGRVLKINSSLFKKGVFLLGFFGTFRSFYEGSSKVFPRNLDSGNPGLQRSKNQDLVAQK